MRKEAEENLDLNAQEIDENDVIGFLIDWMAKKEDRKN